MEGGCFACLMSREEQVLHLMLCCWAEGWALGCFEGWLLGWHWDWGMPDLAQLQLPRYLHRRPCRYCIDPFSDGKTLAESQ